MKKLLTFFLVALLTFSVSWADDVTYTFTSKFWQASPENWTGTANGNQFNTSGTPLGVQVTTGAGSGATVTCPQSYSNISSIVVTYSSSKSVVGNVAVYVGDVLVGTQNVSKSQTRVELTYPVSNLSGVVKFVPTVTTNSMGINSVKITYSGGDVPAEPNWYHKMTSTSELVAGQKYIFIYENGTSSVGMGAIANGYGTAISGLSVENNKVNIAGTGVAEFTLEGTVDAWTFRTNDNKYLATTSSPYDGLSVQSSSIYSDTKWTIEDYGWILNNSEDNYIRYTSNHFALSSTGSAAIIYVQDDETVVESCAAPVFDPDGGFFTGSAEVTITSATEDATIYYTTDGSDPVVSRSSIANGGTVTLTESCTLKAMAVKSGYNNSAIVTSNSYTINPTGGGGSGPFELVTDASTLELGDEIIFVSTDEVGSAQAMSTTQNNNNRPGTTVDVVSGPKVSATSSTQIFTLQGSPAGWYFYTGDGYIYAQSSTGNNMRTEEVADDNAKATISISNNEATVVFQGTNTHNNLRFNPNNGSPIFSCYSSTSTQQKPFIYRRSGTPSLDPFLAITPATQTISDAAPAQLTITGENVNGNINASLATNADWYLNPTSFGNTGGSATLTYTGRALSASNTVTASASGADDVTATVNYVSDIYIVTDNGVTGDWHFDGQYGVQMTNDNGIYTADFTVTTPNTYILFARKLGNDVTWNTRYVFGPNSTGDWWLPVSGNGGGSLDLNDDDPIKIQTAGFYTITINANDGTFSITKRNIDVTITPADGTHFTGSSISGTIASDPAGTIEWSTDGTNWQSYTDSFTATVSQPGQSVTVFARSTVSGIVSDVVSATYTRDYAPAPAAPVFSRPGGDVAAGTVVTITAPEGCTLYVDGQQVNNPYEVTINSATTISAYCINDEGTQSETVSYSFNISTVCEAVIEFDDNGTDASSNVTNNSIWDYILQGDDYFTSVSGISRVFQGATGLKYGNSSNGGTITFNLDTEFNTWKVTHVILNAKQYNNSDVTFTVTTSADESQTTSTLASDYSNYSLDFNGTEITSITISSSARAYLKGFTIVYDCAPEVVAPVITPATGTYYESQSVTMTSEPGTTIYYTTDGSTPTTSNTVYNGEFTAPYSANGTYTINAIAVDALGTISPMSTVTYTWGTTSVVINPDSRNVTNPTVTVTLTAIPAGATIYYTTDGTTPTTSSTVYNGAFTVSLPEVGNTATVNAIAVYGSLTSEMASATYTRVEKTIDVNAPFFSPLENQTYYGNQTLKMACTTPNADIHYEITEVAGTTHPTSADVNDPTKSSTYYEGQTINMTEGNSYYVKAIAYVGDFASTISEGWYVIEEFVQTGNVYQNLKDFNDNCPEGVTASFVNPVQVVYHSTYTNDGQMAEYCYVRDNTDYALIYFGKADQNNYHIFQMGDWIDGSKISGTSSKPNFGYHIQIGTSTHSISTNWPGSPIGHNEILPEETTCSVIYGGVADGENSWGHYVHLRNSTLSGVADESTSDMKHNGYITDHSGTQLNYYDKFYRWSAGTCSYGSHTYNIHALGDYNQAFFDQKQNAGATFDVYGVVDYYSTKGFQICPIDFLWIYKPVIVPASNDQCDAPFTATIEVDQPEWTDVVPTIYYKTDDMEDWAIYTPGQQIPISSTTELQTYAEIPAEKSDGTNYNDFVTSEVVTANYVFPAVKEPIVNPEGNVYDANVTTSVDVTVSTNPESSTGTKTYYTTDGSDPRTSSTRIEVTGTSAVVTVDHDMTINAVSELVVGGNTIYSNVVSETYQFIQNNDKRYNLLKTATPKVNSIYVIVNKADNVGLSTTQNTTNRTATGVMFTSDNKEIVMGNPHLAEFILEGASAGRYYFRQVGTDNYLTVTTNDNPNLMTGSKDAYAEAAVSVNTAITSGVDESYPATVMFSYDGTRRYLRYYEDGRTFTTYDNATTNEDVFLYGIECPDLIAPSITPAGHDVEAIDGVGSEHVTVTTNDQNPTGTKTAYTTDGTSPINNPDAIVIDGDSYDWDITETTTVTAVSFIEFADTLIWSEEVVEEYVFVNKTSLYNIELEGTKDVEYIVANELIGVWAVEGEAVIDGNTVKYNFLLAKDEDYPSVDPTSPIGDQVDYVKDIWGLEKKEDWDQSNWVLLDFSGLNDVHAAEFEGHRLNMGTVRGVYSDDLNYTIVLTQTPGKQETSVTGYPGNNGDYEEVRSSETYFYNHYTPSNFIDTNLNNNGHTGAVAAEPSAAAGKHIFFMNPKIQEVAQVWAVWAGVVGGKDKFDVYKMEGNTVNGYNLEGAFNVDWRFNMLQEVNGQRRYGRAADDNGLEVGRAYLFHVMVNRNNLDYGHRKSAPGEGTPNGSTPSSSFAVYPLDLPKGANFTSVNEFVVSKQVMSVRYFNVMGMESSVPFEGVNIVVTRYSDGTISTAKVLK